MLILTEFSENVPKPINHNQFGNSSLKGSVLRVRRLGKFFMTTDMKFKSYININGEQILHI